MTVPPAMFSNLFLYSFSATCRFSSIPIPFYARGFINPGIFVSLNSSSSRVEFRIEMGYSALTSICISSSSTSVPHFLCTLPSGIEISEYSRVLHLGQCSQTIQPGIGALRASCSFFALRSARFITFAVVSLILRIEVLFHEEQRSLIFQTCC